MDILDAFLSHRPISGVYFEHNDYVAVVFGEHAGHCGSLVSILSADADPCFLLESDAGDDLEVFQSQLELAQDSQAA